MNTLKKLWDRITRNNRVRVNTFGVELLEWCSAPADKCCWTHFPGTDFIDREEYWKDGKLYGVARYPYGMTMWHLKELHRDDTIQ